MAMSDRSVLLAVEDEEARRLIVHEQLGKPLDRCRELLFAALGDNSWRVRKEAVEVLVASRPGREDCAVLIELLRDEDNAGLRNAAVELLVRLGKRVVPTLMAHLHDPDHDLRKMVVDALAAIGDRSALPGLVVALADSDINVAAAAAEALGASGDHSVVPALLQALEQQPHYFFRFNVLTALGRIGVPGPLSPVVAGMARQEMQRLAVYRCLGRIGGDTAAADLLLEGVQSGLPSVRAAAICSLVSVMQNLEPLFHQATLERVRFLADQGLLENLLAAYDGSDLSLAEAVVTLLGMIADPRGVPLLIQAITDERLAHKAFTALTSIGNAALVPAVERFSQADELERAAICTLINHLGQTAAGVEQVVLRALKDDVYLVRRAAALAVGVLPGTTLLIASAALLDDEEQTVREAALQTLRRRSNTDSELIREVAVQLLGSDRPEQRKGAALLCAATGDCELLARLIKDEHPSVREAGVRAVGRLRLRDSCTSLVMALVDEVEPVRIAAAEALGSCSDHGIVSESLCLALRDTSPWVQAAALRSLVELSGSEVLPEVLELWQRGAEVAQLACLEVLDLIEAPEGFALVSQALGQRDGEVLKSAIAVLARHAPELLMPWFNHILSHQDWDVRLAAVRACATLPGADRDELLQISLDREEHDLVRLAIQQLLDSR